MSDANAFAAAERRYRELDARYQRGDLSEDAFQQERMACLVQDASGRAWLPAPEAGRWYLWDGQQWALSSVFPVAAAAPAPTPPPTPQTGYAPQPAPAASYQQPAPQQAYAEPRRRKRGGCCLVILILLLLVAAAGVWISPLPQRWGLRKTAAQRLLGPPDRRAADAILMDMAAGGLPTDGVYLYVLPLKGESTNTLYAVLDSRDGFRFEGSGSREQIVDYLVTLAESPAVTGQNVGRISVDYRDAAGESTLVLTAPTEAILGFSRGELSRDEFMQVLDGQMDIQQLLMGGL
jgi:hypothetical protein